MHRGSQITYPLLDLFAGCGGLSQGFKDAGFQIATAVEWWESAAITYRHNHPGTELLVGDITEVKKTLFSRYARGAFTGIIGGPPCQGYSVAGNRNVSDPRGALYEQFFDIVDHFRPRFFVMENVKGLLSMRHLDPHLASQEKLQVQEICQKIALFKDLKRYAAQRELTPEEATEFTKLKDHINDFQRKVSKTLVPLANIIHERIERLGYAVTYQVLNAADYGVPQRRERVFFIGSLNSQFLEGIIPVPTHVDPTKHSRQKKELGKQRLPWNTVEDAIKDLENAPASKDLSHIYMHHRPDFVKRLNQVLPGSTVFENYKDAWYRLRPNEPARTVKENHGGVFVHYKEPRCLTPRELARLQSFDDDFRFSGSKSDVLKQIGNAVPPLLARAVASQIFGNLKNRDGLLKRTGLVYA